MDGDLLRGLFGLDPSELRKHLPYYTALLAASFLHGRVQRWLAARRTEKRLALELAHIRAWAIGAGYKPPVEKKDRTVWERFLAGLRAFAGRTDD